MKAARAGKQVANFPSGFPLFCSGRKPRIVTANPWAFFRFLCISRIRGSTRKRALAFVNQAQEFFAAAQNPELGSRPVLLYYSSLNLVKAALLIKGIPIPRAVRHGIVDPRTNERQRIRFTGQRIRVNNIATDHSELYPEFIKLLGGFPGRVRETLLIDLLSQLPSIHRSYLKLRQSAPLFVPIHRYELYRNATHVWARVVLQRSDKDVISTIANLKSSRSFNAVFSAVASSDDQEFWFETDPVIGRRRGVDPAIAALALTLRSTQISPILTASGYRTYFCVVPPRRWLPPLAVGYGVIFYLGSVTRYRPDVFDKILAGGYAWLVEEFLASYPIQFIYILASELAGSDVVKPYASL